MDFNNKNEIIFKIKNIQKINKGKSVEGSECITGTSDIKIEPFINNYITILNKDIIKDKYIGKGEKIKKKQIKYKKQNLCLIYQLVLRKLRDENNELYILRPLERRKLIVKNEKILIKKN
jgi:hypothetical protein